MYSIYMNAKYSKSLHILITPEQHSFLEKRSKKSGDSIGKFVRKLIDVAMRFKYNELPKKQ